VERQDIFVKHRASLKQIKKTLKSFHNNKLTFLLVPCSVPSENVCLNNGTCYVNAGTVLCLCQPGYQGAYCEILVDNCDSCPCLHGGTCNNSVNSYTCFCTQYYTGANCEIGKL